MDQLFQTLRRRPVAAACIALCAALGAAGGLAAEIQSRALRQSFPLAPGTALRLANLAGRVDLAPGQGAEVVVEATLHADFSGQGETERQLAALKWVKAHDRKGREEWALSYPVETYHSYHYPNAAARNESFWSIFDNSSSSTIYRGVKVRVYSGRRSPSSPTLYADLKITLPSGANVAVRNLVGSIHGAGNLEGVLALDTGSGNIELASYSGQLRLDTGSGDVAVGTTRGETSIDTGSGDVRVHEMVGNGVVDTGSGDVRIEKVSVGRLKLDTGSGEVVVRDGVAGKLQADTGSGGVKVIGVEVEELIADTGSGEVEIVSSLARARSVTVKTGSGDVRIQGGAAAAFDVAADQGSGELRVDYADATLRRSGRKVVGAHRGDGHTSIRVETGSGDCVISHHGASG